MSHPTHRRLRRTCALAAATLTSSLALAQTSTWTLPTSGTWSDPTNWSTNPTYPNSPTTDALLSATGSPYTLTLNTPVSLNSLTGTSPDATLNLTTGGSLTLSSSLNLGPTSLTLTGGKLTGGTLSSDLTATGFNASTLDATSLASTLTAYARVTLGPSFTLASGTIRLAAPGTILNLASTTAGASLTGSGQVIFDSPSPTSPPGLFASTLPATTTIGPNVTVRTGLGSGSIGFATGPNPLVNQGTISAQTPGQTLTVFASNLTNTGTIEATNNATLRLSGLFGLPTPLSSISTSNGGQAYAMSSNIFNTATYTLSAGHAVGLGNGTNFNGGTIASADGTPLTIYPFTSTTQTTPTGTATLTSVNVLAPVSIRAGATLLPLGSTTLAGILTATGGTLSATISSPSLPGSYSFSNSATFNLTAAPTGPLGSFSFTDSTANINISPSNTTFTPTSLTIAGTSAINIGNALANTGKTISLSPNSTLTLTNFGSITGGSITGGGTLVVKSSIIPSLNNLTLDCNLSIQVVTQITTPLSFAGAHIAIDSRTNTNASLSVGLLDGSADISLEGSNSQPFVPSLGTSLINNTLPAGFAVHTGTGGGRVSFPTIAGTLSAQSPGLTLGVSTATLTGTAQAKNGGILSVTVASPLLTGSSSALSLNSGTWNVYDASSLILSTPNPKIVNIASPASITLSGPTSQFDALATLSTNNGSLTLTHGRTFTTQSSFSNTGTLTLGPSAALKVTGSLSNPGTLSLTGGTLLIDYTGASPIDDLRQQLLTHHLTTPLPHTTIAYAEASLLPPEAVGLLAAGLPTDPTTLLTKLTAPGDANLDGSITPDDYALLDRALAQQTPNPHWTEGDFNYDGIIDNQDYLLIDQSLFTQSQSFTPGFLAQRESQFGPTYVSTLLASVPEPTFLLACGFAIPTLRPGRSRR